MTIKAKIILVGFFAVVMMTIFVAMGLAFSFSRTTHDQPPIPPTVTYVHYAPGAEVIV